MQNTPLGERLSRLRRYLRISQDLLGKRVLGEKSRQYVASIESGDRSPTLEDLEALRKVFRLPDVAYLIDEEKFKESANFRIEAATSTISNRGETSDFDDIELAHFEKEVDEICIKESKTFNGQMATLAAQEMPLALLLPTFKSFLRDIEFNVIEDNVFLLPEKLGIVLKFTALSKLSGASIKTTNGNYGILINSNQYFTRQKFNLFHEIAHLILGHNEKDQFIKSAMGKNFDSHEVDADKFASEILMPDELITQKIREAVDSNISPKTPEFILSLCESMGVSFQAMVTRLKNMSYLSRADSDSLFKLKVADISGEKLLKASDPESVEAAQNAVEEILKETDIKFDLKNSINGVTKLRNLQEGTYSKLIGKFSARLIYEEVAYKLFKDYQPA